MPYRSLPRDEIDFSVGFSNEHREFHPVAEPNRERDVGLDEVVRDHERLLARVSAISRLDDLVNLDAIIIGKREPDPWVSRAMAHFDVNHVEPRDRIGERACREWVPHLATMGGIVGRRRSRYNLSARWCGWIWGC